MTSAIPIWQRADGTEETFLAPAFEIAIEGRGLPRDVVRDVRSVVYKDNVAEIDSVELAINNWDADEARLKYVGFPGELPGEPGASRYAGLFDPGQELRVSLGYQPRPELMMKAQITTLEPQFPKAGAPVLTVRGLNVLHKFRGAQHTWGWEERTDSEIAQELGRLPVSDSRPGLGVEVRTDPTAAAAEQAEPFVFMDNQHDIVFLLERARRRGYDLAVELDPQTRRERLRFGPSETSRNDPYELAWGRSLIELKPTLTTANQVSQVTVRGWNRRTRRPIEATAKIGDRGIEINRDQDAVAQAVAQRHEVVVDRPVHSVAEAQALARDILRNQLKEMVKATGATVGLPGLRAGRRVHVTGLGPRFGGEYYITETTHRLDAAAGYGVTFGIRRERSLEDAA